MLWNNSSCMHFPNVFGHLQQFMIIHLFRMHFIWQWQNSPKQWFHISELIYSLHFTHLITHKLEYLCSADCRTQSHSFWHPNHRYMYTWSQDNDTPPRPRSEHKQSNAKLMFAVRGRIDASVCYTIRVQVPQRSNGLDLLGSWATTTLVFLHGSYIGYK